MLFKIAAYALIYVIADSRASKTAIGFECFGAILLVLSLGQSTPLYFLYCRQLSFNSGHILRNR
jgi:hypothetical protein